MDSKAIIKKYYRVLIFYIVTTLLVIGGMAVIFFSLENEDVSTTINIVLLIVLLILATIFKSIISGYQSMAQVARVVLNQSEPIKYYGNIFNSEQYFKENDYELKSNNESYSIYYKLEETIKFKIFKNRRLKTIVIIKDENIEFYSKVLHDELEQFSLDQFKVQKYYKQIILVFKNIKKLRKDDITEIGEVVSYQVGRQRFTQINVAVNDQDKRAYFLYSNKYYPTADYKDAVLEIKKIIS